MGLGESTGKTAKAWARAIGDISRRFGPTVTYKAQLPNFQFLDGFKSEGLE